VGKTPAEAAGIELGLENNACESLIRKAAQKKNETIEQD